MQRRDVLRAGLGAVALQLTDYLTLGYQARVEEDLGGDAAVVGKSIRLGNTPFTIVGVTPPEFLRILEESK